MTENVSVGELARQVREVLARFQILAERLDNTYVTKEVHSLYQKVMEQNMADMRRTAEIAAKATEVADLKGIVEHKASVADLAELKLEKAEKSIVDGVDARVKSLEDNQKWLVRLVLALLIAAIVGTVLVTNGAAP